MLKGGRRPASFSPCSSFCPRAGGQVPAAWAGQVHTPTCGGGGGGGRGAAGATSGPAGHSGSGRSTPPAARTAATGSSTNYPPGYAPLQAATLQLRANHAQERLPVAPQLHAAAPRSGQVRRGGATLPNHFTFTGFLTPNRCGYRSVPLRNQDSFCLSLLPCRAALCHHPPLPPLPLTSPRALHPACLQGTVRRWRPRHTPLRLHPLARSASKTSAQALLDRRPPTTSRAALQRCTWAAWWNACTTTATAPLAAARSRRCTAMRIFARPASAAASMPCRRPCPTIPLPVLWLAITRRVLCRGRP